MKQYIKKHVSRELSNFHRLQLNLVLLSLGLLIGSITAYAKNILKDNQQASFLIDDTDTDVFQGYFILKGEVNARDYPGSKSYEGIQGALVSLLSEEGRKIADVTSRHDGHFEFRLRTTRKHLKYIISVSLKKHEQVITEAFSIDKVKSVQFFLSPRTKSFQYHISADIVDVQYLHEPPMWIMMEYRRPMSSTVFQARPFLFTETRDPEVLEQAYKGDYPNPRPQKKSMHWWLESSKKFLRRAKD